MVKKLVQQFLCLKVQNFKTFKERQNVNAEIYISEETKLFLIYKKWEINKNIKSTKLKKQKIRFSGNKQKNLKKTIEYKR